MAALREGQSRQAEVYWYRHPRFGYGLRSREQQDVWPEEGRVFEVKQGEERVRVRCLGTWQRGARQPGGAIIWVRC